MGSSHDAFREEDEYAESTAMDEEDEFASVSTTYQQNRQKQQQQEQKQQHYQSQTKPSNAYEHGGRSSFEDRLDYDIGEETTSLIDEQPSFLEEARHSLRSPRAYGSPAAKSFVASRMARSPPPGRGHVQAPNFSGSLVRNKRSVGDAHALNQQHQQQQQQIPQLNSRSSFEDDRNTVSDASNGASQSNARRLAGPLAGTNTANAGSSLIGGTRGLRPPAMARSGSVSYESSAAAIERDAAVRHQQSQSQTLRSNTYSNSTAASTDAYQATASSSPYTSALSVPSDDNSSSSKRGVAGQSNSGNNTRNVDGEDAIMTSPAEDRGDADDMFGGLRIADVESLVSQHRAEIRATTEACKEETTLIAAYTSFTYAHLAQQSRNRADAYNNQQQQRSRPNSWQQQTQNITDKYYLDTSTGEVTRLTDGLKFDSVDQAKMHEAMEYLEKLDDVLARKQQLVVDLRASIRKLVWNSSGQTN
ncbi:hypothetical protein GGI05_005663 [Coemansia sp. RSA 2603]|nr:hypothetical protein GGI05_005663 [Coemansia sp. RSA 2603]